MTAGAGRTWTDEDVVALAQRLDNAGRWGPDDELGTLNFIRPEHRIAAAGLVRSGITVSLARPLEVDASLAARVDLDHNVVHMNAADERFGTPPFAGEYIGLESHQPGVTHLDAVGHIGGFDGRIYGGRRFDDEVADDGLHFGSVYAQRPGIFSRGVLLDVAAALGVDWLEPEHEVTGPDLDAAERHASVTVGTGDVVVLRVGIGARANVHGPSPSSPGPGPDAARWLHDREVALFVSDSPEHITPMGARILGRVAPEGPPPSGTPETRFPLVFHQLALPFVGLVLLDHAEVEALAIACRELGRHEFLFIAAPLALPNGTGSPVNPMAVF